MATNTIGKMTSCTTYQELIGMLKSNKKFSEVKVLKVKDGKASSYINDDGEEVEYFDNGSAYISLKYYNTETKENEERTLFCIAKNVDESEESTIGTVVKEEYMYCSVCKWGASIELMREILSYFGGYLIEDDCEEKTIKINKSENIDEEIEKYNELFNSLKGKDDFEKFNFISMLEENKSIVKSFFECED